MLTPTLTMDTIQLMPETEKEDYLEAVKNAPYLFEDSAESDPMKWIRRCEYDVFLASKRFCKYWKLRRKYFGDRAFLPMVLGGNGALSKDDTFSLEAGFPCILPPLNCGKQVVYADRQQWVHSLTRDHRLRTVIYVMTVIAEDERAQTEGCIVLGLAVAPTKFQETDFRFVKEMADLVKNALPVKARFEFICFKPRSAKDYVVQNFIATAMRVLESVGVSVAEDTDFHFEREKGDLYQALSGLGFTHEGIPNLCGGSWTMLDFMDWCRKRSSIELERHKWTLQAARRDLRGDNGQRADTMNLESAEDKLARKRAINRIHSQRKRERRKQEVQALQDEHEKSLSDNKRLKIENEFLQSLLTKAKALQLNLQSP